MPLTDLGALTEAHNARIRTIDPLIPQAAVPEPEVDEDRLLTVPGGAAYMHRNQVDPSSMLACWGALDQHSLIGVRIGDGDPAGTMRALLATWRRSADGTSGEETSAALTWPSRDTAMVRPLLDSGLVPRVVVAAREAGRPAAARHRAGVEIRRLGPEYIDNAARLATAIVEWDAQFGGVTVRASTPQRIREDMTEMAADANERAWLAIVDGEPVGLITVDLPAEPWIAPMVNAERPAYIGYLSVAAGRRGAGVGSALVSHVHARLDAVGCDATLLHHAMLNPLSGPFWNQWGYRPLWTGYDVRPYTALLSR